MSLPFHRSAAVTAKHTKGLHSSKFLSEISPQIDWYITLKNSFFVTEKQICVVNQSVLHKMQEIMSTTDKTS